MPGQVENEGFFERLSNDRKKIAGGGQFMFFLGLIAFFMAFWGAIKKLAEDGNTDGLMTLSSVVLLSMGYPMMVYAGLLKKLQATEDRLKNLEETIGGSSSAKSGGPSEQ